MRLPVFTFSVLILFAPSPADARPVVDSLRTTPPSDSSLPVALVPVNGRIVIEHVHAIAVSPDVSAVVNSDEPQPVALIVIGQRSAGRSLYTVSLESLGVSVGDSVELTSELFQDPPIIFEVAERDDVDPVVDNPTLSFFSEGLSNACCDDPQSRACGVGVGIEIPAASDTYAIAYYEIFDEAGIRVDLVSGHGALAAGQLTGAVVLHPGTQETRACYTVVAVDLAGNRTTYSEGCLDLETERSCFDQLARCSCTAFPLAGWPASLFGVFALFFGLRRRKVALCAAVG